MSDMTPEERAERLYQKLLTPKASVDCSDPTILIAEQIKQAEQEATRKAIASITDSAAYERGFRDAVERAAKICELKVCGLDVIGDSRMKFTAKDIRQLNPGDKC